MLGYREWCFKKLERASAEAIPCANRRIYEALSEPLPNGHRHRLDDLLKRRDIGKTAWLALAAAITGQTELAPLVAGAVSITLLLIFFPFFPG